MEYTQTQHAHPEWPSVDGEHLSEWGRHYQMAICRGQENTRLGGRKIPGWVGGGYSAEREEDIRLGGKSIFGLPPTASLCLSWFPR